MLIKTCFAFSVFNISIAKMTSYYRIHFNKIGGGGGGGENPGGLIKVAFFGGGGGGGE